MSYKGGTSGAATVSASATPTGAAYFKDNGHYYDFVDPGTGNRLTWTGANTAASNRIFNGLTGYLVTITSATEEAFVSGKVPDNLTSWVRASDTA